MPFSSLDPKSQKFLKKYFKSALPFRDGTSQTDKDQMADEYQRWLDARTEFVRKLQGFPSYLGTAKIVADLKTASDLVEKDKKSFNGMAGLQELQRLSGALDTIGQQYVTRLTQEAQRAVARMQAMKGTAVHRQKSEKRLADMQTAAARTPPDFDTVRSAHSFILADEPVVQNVANAFATDFNQVTGWINDVRARFPEISDPVVAADKQAIAAKLVQVEKLLDEHAIVPARNLIGAAWGAVDAAVLVVRDQADYIQLKSETEVDINKLMAKRNPGAEEECAAITAGMLQAVAAASKRDFGTTHRILEDLKKRARTELSFAQGYLDFEASAKSASEAIAKLAAHPQSKFALGQIAEARSVFAQAEALAGTRAYAQAVNRLSMISAICDEAAVKAAGAAQFTRFEDAVTNDAPERILLGAENLIKSLEAHPRAALISEAITDLKKRQVAANKGVDEFDDDAARMQLKQLGELASGARRLADIIDALMGRAERVIQRIADLRDTHGQAKYVEVSLKEALDTAKSGSEAAAKGQDTATGFLDQAELALERARKLADGQELYLIRKSEVKTAADDAMKLTFPDKTAAQSRINDTFQRAEALSKALDPIKARGALQAIMNEVGSAKIASKAKSGTPPNRQEVLDIIAQPDGQKMLDRLITQLGPNDVTQEVMVAMLSARFDMDVKLFQTKADLDAGQAKATLTGPAPNLLAYYKMMTKVPDTHTKLNESLLRFDEIEEVGKYDSFYRTEKRQVVMGLGGAMGSGSSLSDPNQLEDIDPDCVSIPDSPQKPQPNYGTWTTLHEIGHAVDDAKSFMKGRGNGAAFGGWTEHGSDISSIAKAVAKEYDYDAFYIERLLVGGAPDEAELPASLVDNPNGPTIWGQRKQKVMAWHAAMSEGAKPWNNKRAPTDFDIGGKVYHEAYANTWVSYDSSARKQGVTGYQFRAPGEWFSELYAAYHTGKLNPKHPAAKWLSTL